MKNSASNSSNTQALQIYAQQLLPLLTQALSSRHYSEIAHQRLSQQNIDLGWDAKNQHVNYQGLTRAQHPQFGKVMIKWQLNSLSENANHNSTKLTDLAYEAKVLTSIHNLSNYQNTLIAPSVLAYAKSIVHVIEPPQQLTILVMPYYSKGSLINQLSYKKYPSLTLRQKHHFIMQTADLIDNLHKIGWLHNDIKPSNILLDDFLIGSTLADSTINNEIQPNLLLTDFALAECFASSNRSNPAGTPAYLAPERWQGQGATLQSDIYAFGIMVYELLMGERPFKVNVQSSHPMTDWAIQHCQQSVPKLLSEHSRYQHIINKLLAKRVAKRYQSMDEVLVDLRRL